MSVSPKHGASVSIPGDLWPDLVLVWPGALQSSGTLDRGVGGVAPQYVGAPHRWAWPGSAGPRGDGDFTVALVTQASMYAGASPMTMFSLLTAGAASGAHVYCTSGVVGVLERADDGTNTGVAAAAADLLSAAARVVYVHRVSSPACAAVWINGTLVGSTAAPQQWVVQTSMQVGGYLAAGTETFSGQVTQLYLFGRALGTGEVARVDAGMAG